MLGESKSKGLKGTKKDLKGLDPERKNGSRAFPRIVSMEVRIKG